MTAMLPEQFAALEPYAPTWCLPTEAERWNQRLASSMAEIVEFYDAAFPRFEEAVTYCDKYPLDDLPADVTNLLYLVYSLTQAAVAVEIFGQPMTVDAADAVLNRIQEPTP